MIIVHIVKLRSGVEKAALPEGGPDYPGPALSQTEADAEQDHVELYKSLFLLVNFVDIADGTAKPYRYDHCTDTCVQLEQCLKNSTRQCFSH